MSGMEPIERKSSVEERELATQLSLQNLIWSRRHYEFKNFAKKLATPQPILISQGRIQGWEPSAEVRRYPMLFAMGRRYQFKVVAQCAFIHPEYKHAVGTMFEIDDDFRGWFEILSEDGFQMFRIQRVSELAHYRNKTFVVMKKVHAHKYVDRTWSMLDLDIGVEISVFPIEREPVKADNCSCGNLLKCRTLSGDCVYLPLLREGSFALFGEDFITGPQTISSLCSLRFPINVKLMEGCAPPIDSAHFVPTMRLFRAEFEEVLTVWTMRKGDPLMHVPTKSILKVKVLENLTAVRDLPLFNDILRHIQTLLPKGRIRGSNQPRPFQPFRTALPPYHGASHQQITVRAPFHRQTSETSDKVVSSTTGIPPSNTSGELTLSSTELPWRRKFGFSEATPLPQPSTSGSIVDVLKTTQQTGGSSPLNAAYTPRSSTPISHSTAQTYIQPSSTSEEVTEEASTDIHQPSTSGLQKLPKKNFFLSKYIREYSCTSKSITSEDSFYQPKSIEEQCDQKASGPEPISVPQQIGTSEQGVEQPTPSGLSDVKQEDTPAASESKRTKGGPSPTEVRRSPRIKAQQRRGREDSTSYAVAELKRFCSKVMGEPGTSGQAVTNPSTLRRSPRRQTPLKKDDQPTQSTLPSDAIGPLQLDESSDEKESSIDPYDEIDDIYEEKRRLFLERSNIPLEKETFL